MGWIARFLQGEIEPGGPPRWVVIVAAIAAVVTAQIVTTFPALY